MARPLRLEFPGALYAVSARAVPRQKLFRSPEEIADFAARLPELGTSFGAVFHGYCLLPNHYHLLVETPLANVSRVLHRLNSGYTARVNARRSRKGPLLQSRYRAVLLDPEWLLRLSIYVHLNPVRKKLAADPWAYAGSSARAFRPGGEGLPGVQVGTVLGLAGGAEAYAESLDRAALARPVAPWGEVWRQVVLGGEALRARALDAASGKNVREIAGFGSDRGSSGLDEIVRAVSEGTGVAEREILKGKFQRVLARKLAIHLARRFTGLTLREIGEAFGVDYTTVHMAARRVEELRASDSRLDGLLRTIEDRLAGRPREVEAQEAKAKGPGGKRRPRGGQGPGEQLSLL